MIPITLGSMVIAEAAVNAPELCEDKDKLPLMFPHLSVDERIGIWCEYLAFCGDKTEMEADPDFLRFPHVFSLRRDYQSDPLYGMSYDRELKCYLPNGTGMLSRPFEQHVFLQCLHSYSGENDQLVIDGVKNGVWWVQEKLLSDPDYKAVRTDLFQIYWTKGTDVRKFLAKELHYVVEYFMQKMQVKGPPMPIMELAEDVYAWMGKNTSQNRMKYSTKDACLDLSLCFPSQVDPESFLEAGTGCRRGLHQIFGVRVKADHGQQQEMYDRIKAHPRYPLEHNHYSRIEAQVCYGFKLLAHKARILPADKRAQAKHKLLGERDPLCKTHYPVVPPNDGLGGFF